MDRQTLQARLLELFVEELAEQVQSMNGDLLALEANPADPERLRSLFRTAHTLKGAARAAGITAIEGACHALEDLLAGARDLGAALSPGRIQLLFSAADALGEAGNRLRAGEPLDERALSALEGEVAALPAEAGDAPPARVQPAPPPEATPEPVESAGPAVAPAALAETPRGTRAPDRNAVRVGADRLDELLATTGEFLALGRRLEVRSHDIETLDQFHAEWTQEWQRQLPRLGAILKRAEVDDVAQAALSSMTSRLRQFGEHSRRLSLQANADARQIGRIGGALSDQIRRLRMRPLDEALESLPRTVRDLALSNGKEVQLEMHGVEVQVDRAVLDALREAILPVVRNAIDHGLETPEARLRAGKPAQGTIRVSGELHRDRVVVTIADDGAGFDTAALRKRLAAAGHAPSGDDSELGAAVLEGGVTSRSEATRISGRGVGLDIVRAAMERVRGVVRLTWTEGEGTEVRLECPPSLATLRALLVAVGPQMIAIPTMAIERLLRLPVDDLQSAQGLLVLATEEGPVPLVSLAAVLGPPLVDRPLAGFLRILLLSTREGRAAVIVDEFVAEEELVIRPLNTGRNALPLIAGAAILGSGGVAPLVDATALVGSIRSGGRVLRAREQPGDAGAARRILVADDSLTTRTLEQSVLEAAGYIVVTAVDGHDAWRLLQEREIDLLVSDVDMPRLDGIGLCERLRASPRFQTLPVVLVTGRESAEDRARGLEVGADAYLAKSSFDQEQLLATIQQLLD